LANPFSHVKKITVDAYLLSFKIEYTSVVLLGLNPSALPTEKEFFLAAQLMPEQPDHRGEGEEAP
jgi:hypothetical protein